MFSTRIIIDAPTPSADYYQLANVQMYGDRSYTLSLIPTTHYDLIRECNEENVTPRQRELKCRRAFIERQCGMCSPGGCVCACVCVCVLSSTYSNNQHSATLPSLLLTEQDIKSSGAACKLEDYRTCLSNGSIMHNNTDVYRKCINECLPACDHWLYELRAIDERGDVNVSTHTHTHTISQGAGVYIPYNEYVHISQRVAYTWDMVIANFGGLLEFWIGAGLVSFLHMALFITEKVC